LLLARKFIEILWRENCLNASRRFLGYVDFFEQSPIDIFPPQFILRTIPPGGIVPQVLTPFAI
jgi:hypothetical protein